jgi:hypothetical protein
MASLVSNNTKPRENWFEWLLRLIAEELAPRPRRVSTSFRYATISTVATGLMAACHVDSPLGPYLSWLLLGGGPMMSLEKAVIFLLAEGATLALSVPVSGILAETPWLILPAIGIFVAFTTRINTLWKLGAIGLVMEVVTLDTFYGVAFAPDNLAELSRRFFVAQSSQ